MHWKPVSEFLPCEFHAQTLNNLISPFNFLCPQSQNQKVKVQDAQIQKGEFRRPSTKCKILTHIFSVLLRFDSQNIRDKILGTKEEHTVLDQVKPTSTTYITTHWSCDTKAGSLSARVSCLQLLLQLRQQTVVHWRKYSLLLVISVFLMWEWVLDNKWYMNRIYLTKSTQKLLTRQHLALLIWSDHLILKLFKLSYTTHIYIELYYTYLYWAILYLFILSYTIFTELWGLFIKTEV